ncbi:glycoside hydrolase family 3 C-terminal domain-containing protein [uncultured Eubacterium sp.]|uniref:glycoside hydrolase family 3 protein n=1 Tax=uncultured Eubacterium sp. TaxID=165185 RepID=UPI0025F4E94B|nr:glycoside hydrolase family 3 protein [uncultured Eubacterium sp.]MCI6536733.1 glycoside hydrolase family 3 C-terminal domain-containing protein [Lachnospiraceae bacterium]
MKLRKRGYVGNTSTEMSQREKDNAILAREAAAEGFVLLKNEAQTLPLKPGTKIGLYGAGAVRTIKGGTGSGDVNNRYNVNIYDGLKNAGFEITSGAWLDGYDSCYIQARENWKAEIFRKLNAECDGNFFEAYSTTPFSMPAGAAVEEAAAKADGADVGIYVLARIAGENADRRDEPGDYYITEEERAQIAALCVAYEKVILVVNTGGLIDLAFTDVFPNITAILQYVQAGQEGGNALADVISGKVTPSGKMTDTWALDYMDYPNAAYFSHKSGDVYREEYREGIYVGYRYFDTFDVPVRYSFGYGLSYTEFDIKVTGISKQTSAQGRRTLLVCVDVTNSGAVYAGKEVVQVYVSCPQGTLPKEYRRLAAFEKTKLLAPGETQSLTLTIDLYQLASYSEEQAAWLLEAGTYGIWTGNALSTAALCGTFVLDEDKILVQCEHICPLKEKLEELQPDKAKLEEKQNIWMQIASEKQLPQLQISAKELLTETVVYEELQDHYPGKAGEIVDQLSTEELIALATGDPAKDQGASALGSAGQTVPGAAAETVNAAEKDPYNVASIVLADGPAGLRLRSTYQVREDGSIDGGDFLDGFENGYFAEPKEPTGTVYHQYCTAIPVGTLLAQSWNPELMHTLGRMIAGEMNEFEVTLWLAPGMSLHRNPLCGRNFEYYSEDPLLAGRMAAAMTQGVQSVPGCGTTIKHYACNNQEDNRMGSDSILSERTLREIYLKGFEIAIRDAQPMAMMTSYNLINGVHAANNYDICTKAARDEWGFAGAIMTDWTTTTDSTAGECTAAGCMKAGNDMVMPGDLRDHASIRQALEDGSLDIRELKRCVYHTVKIILQSNQYEDAVSYEEQFNQMK